MDKTYNYREEIDKIIKEKNIVFYDKDFDEGDERRYNISADRLKEIDRLEKKLSIMLNEHYDYCTSPDYIENNDEDEDEVYEELPATSKEYFISYFKDHFIDDEKFEEKDSKNLLYIYNYEFSLNYWIEFLSHYL